MTTKDTSSANERAPSHSLTALTLLADPVSTLLDRDRLGAIADVALRRDRSTSHGELALLHDCAQDLNWLHPKLKRAFTDAYASGDIDAPSARRLVDRLELWGD
jgi:hypothetical protein